MPAQGRLFARIAGTPRWQRRLAGVLAVLAGPWLAWRSYLARGTTCGASTPLDGQASIYTCVPQEWQAWWRWPGVALGLFVLLLGVAILVATRRARAPAPAARGRRRPVRVR